MRTMFYGKRPRILAASGIAGKKEGEGPLGESFDELLPDDLLGQKSWEAAETEMLTRTIKRCLDKGGMTESRLAALLAGDLENQICASSFADRTLGVPFFGLYGACSTVVEALTLGGALVDGGYLPNAVCAASSHFCTAERQFRFPLELGNQRPPAAQWTATAAGALLLHPSEGRAVLECGVIGRVVDYAITDANHMGAAMAPAVCDTLCAHFREASRTHEDFDLIVTGDLGLIGAQLLLTLLKDWGFPVPPEKLYDCGAHLFDAATQDTHAGGSGCGCIASVLACEILPKIQDGTLRRVLALGSGALLSPTSSQQGESIPGISYGVSIQGVNV